MNKPSVRHEPTRVFPVESNCRVVGGMSLARLAERIGSTPFYAYDRSLITERDAPLPRNPNGKIDRKTLAHDLAGLFAVSL